MTGTAMKEFNGRRLEIDALRALWAIRRHGGITRAAEALGLSQSAVSHKIKRLETSLDCDLLGRSPGGAMFTAAGEDLLDYAGKILGLHDEALLSLSKASLEGRIALGLTEDTACSDLARILGEISPTASECRRPHQSPHESSPASDAGAGELDAAILQVFAHEVRPTDVVLFREELHWVKHPQLSLPQQGPIPFLSFDDECFYRRWALDIGQDGGVVLETVFECASAAGIVAAVTSAMGVALLSGRHLRPEMQIVTERLPTPPALAYVARRARKVRNSALDTLVAEIENEISRYGGLVLAS
ncbi:LysR family transcriptional regulator (plasmid) [Sinorhizobium meliloti]|nr:LysR family transcriptional regulator [Sinorhizobium meliloti]